MQVVYNNNPPPGAGPRPAETQIDFWDIDGSEAIAQNLAQDYEFSELVRVEQGSERPRQIALAVLLSVLVAGGGYLAYQYHETGDNPLSGIWDTVAQVFGSSEPEQLFEPVIKDDLADVPVVADEPEPRPAEREVVQGNPYWALPNKILGPKVPLNRMWTAEEEETWRAGLAHRFQWQRHKTVLDVRRARLRGSDAILWDALHEKKFWTRMQAAVGLAEFGFEVSLEAIDGALRGARSELVANFFERFVKRSTPGARFILRQALKLMDERGRLVALRAIDRAGDSMRNLYLVAATRDPGPRVKRFAEQAIARRGISPAEFDRLMAVVEGKDDGKFLTDPNARGAPSVAKEGKAPKMSGEYDYDFGDYDAAFDGDLGEVEFYATPDEYEATAFDDASLDY